ncbi:WD40 repeat domain-containing protein [Pedobacter aquae]|uniref:WD40 repeat domain-containing protein n=2 Tax=Pedobacter aquae TaxID=2605747 RepID=A0A5C0VHW9_9SPHI|nr:WD40 repeat domain-containing protein [Pedobacter aquae]
MMRVDTLEGHNNPVYAVISHPKLPLVYTAGNDKGIVEWDLVSQKHNRIFNQVKSTIYALEIVITQQLLIAGCNDGTLLFFDLTSTKLLKTIPLAAAIFHIKYHPVKEELIVSTDNGSIFIISLTDKSILHQFKSGNEKIRAFDFSDVLNYLVTASNDNSVRIYNLQDYTFIHEFEAHSMGVGAVKFSPDHRFLLTGSRDAHLRSWHTQNWACEHNFPAHLFAIYKIAYHPTLPYFITCSRDKSIKIWRTDDLSLFKNLSIDKGLPGHRLSVNDACWSSDGKYIISVSDDKQVKVWDFTA